MNEQLCCTDTSVFELRSVEIPSAPSAGLIVKVEYAGICHSDAHLCYEDRYKLLLPKVLGHEISGCVYKLGDDYKEGKLKVGDRVVVFPWGGCYNCCWCEHDQLCPNRYVPHAHVYGVWRDGGYQNYISIESPSNVIPVPDGIGLDIASTVPCSGITTYNALERCKDSITRAIKVAGRANVFLMGSGGLGLWFIELAKALYGDKIKLIAADINEDKLKVAKTKGVDDTLLLTREGESVEVAGKIMAAFGGAVDAAVDFVNSPVTMERIVHSLNTCATLVPIGLTQSQLPPLPMQMFVSKGIRLQGIYAGYRDQVVAVFQMMLNGDVKGPEVTHVAITDVERVLKDMMAVSLKESRAVVKMSAP